MTLQRCERCDGGGVVCRWCAKPSLTGVWPRRLCSKHAWKRSRVRCPAHTAPVAICVGWGFKTAAVEEQHGPGYPDGWGDVGRRRLCPTCWSHVEVTVDSRAYNPRAREELLESVLCAIAFETARVDDRANFAHELFDWCLNAAKHDPNTDDDILLGHSLARMDRATADLVVCAKCLHRRGFHHHAGCSVEDDPEGDPCGCHHFVSRLLPAPKPHPGGLCARCSHSQFEHTAKGCARHLPNGGGHTRPCYCLDFVPSGVVGEYARFVTLQGADGEPVRQLVPIGPATATPEEEAAMVEARHQAASYAYDNADVHAHRASTTCGSCGHEEYDHVNKTGVVCLGTDKGCGCTGFVHVVDRSGSAGVRRGSP